MPLAGLLHVCMLLWQASFGRAPEHFKRQGQSILHDPRKEHKAPVIKRSALGLVAIYNMLPNGIQAAKSVKLFQQQLQAMVSEYAQMGIPNGRICFLHVCHERHAHLSCFFSCPMLSLSACGGKVSDVTPNLA